MNNLCPLCDQTLIPNTDNVYLHFYTCPKLISINNQKFNHYVFEKNLLYKSERHVMTISPYRIITYNKYSMIYKYKIDYFNMIVSTKLLNIDPILPMPEKSLRNRLNTILVFS